MIKRSTDWGPLAIAASGATPGVFPYAGIEVVAAAPAKAEAARNLRRDIPLVFSIPDLLYG
jgi:hypothetical protein